MKLIPGVNFFPLEPKLVNGRMQYGAEFRFTAADILKPLPPGTEKHPVIQQLMSKIEADVIDRASPPASSPAPDTCEPQ